MPSYHNDVLPDSPGLNLGSPSQPWNVYASNIFIGEQIIGGGTPKNIPFANPLSIDANGVTVINIGPLTGDVTSSTFTTNITAGTTQFLLIRVTQDGTGGHLFTWPTNFYGVQNVDNSILTMSANQVLSQMLLYIKDTNTAYALAPAAYYP